MKINNMLAGLVLMPYAAIAGMQANQEQYEKVGVQAVSVANIEVLNGIYKNLGLAEEAKKADLAKYSLAMRKLNEALLASTLTDFYGLDEKHSFTLANSGSQYSSYYSFAHLYRGLPVNNEIVTLVLDQDNNISKVIGGIDSRQQMALLKPKKKLMNSLMKKGVQATHATNTSSEAVIAWLTNNENSPFFGQKLTVNSAKAVLDKNTSGEPVYAHRFDLFFIDEKGKPNRVLLVIDSESKEIYRQSELLKLGYQPDSSPSASVREDFSKAARSQATVSSNNTKRLNAFGSNFFSGKREHISPNAPKITDCKFYTSELDSQDYDRGTIITVDMKGQTSFDNWTPYELTNEDCANADTFYESAQLGFTYAYSPLADAHIHAEMVTQLYQELNLGPILGTCSPWPNRESNCKQLYGRYYSSYYAGNDVPIYQGAHYGNSYVGAFWSGQAAYYGDGAFSMLPNVSLDIVAHELTHGFEEISTDDTYMRALDEAISDIAGEAAKEYIYNKTNNVQGVAPYFIGSSYQSTYQYQFGSEAVRNANVAIRVLLDPTVKTMPEQAALLGQHDLSGPLTYVFASLVRDGKFNSFTEAFKVLADSKKTCMNLDGSSTGYELLKKSAQCIVDNANVLELAGAIATSNIAEHLSSAFIGVNVSVDCVEDSLCGVLAAGIQKQENQDHTGVVDYTFTLIENNLGLATSWSIYSGGELIEQSNEAQISITQAQMDNFANTYDVKVNITHQGTDYPSEKSYIKFIPTTYCQASGYLDEQGVATSELYISKIVMQQGVEFPGEDKHGNEGYNYDPGRVINNLTSPFEISVTLGGTDDLSDGYHYLYYWLDRNSDGQFSKDDNDLLYRYSFVNRDLNSPITFNFNFTESEMIQASRLRLVVSESDANITEPCGNFDGEVEDIGVAVAGSSQ